MGGWQSGLALGLVNYECYDQCTCSPSVFLHCDSPCTVDGETYSCKERVQRSVGEGSTVFAALMTIFHECSGQCYCSDADVAGQVDVLTSFSSVTSPQSPQQGSTTPESALEISGGQTNLTSSAEATSAEAAQEHAIAER